MTGLGEQGTDKRLKYELEQLYRTWGADIWGVADLTDLSEYVEQTWGKSYQGLHKAICLGVFFPTEVVEELLEGPSHTYIYYYKVVNTRLDNVALEVANFLHRKGYRAFPIPASQRQGKEKYDSVFSHRLAARLAGLGWIGKNCSLINPQVGPRLRLVTILTNAPLEAGKPLDSQCGSCTVCAEACPSGAITGTPWRAEDPLTARFEPRKCDAYLAGVRTQIGKRVCGKCIASCPWGKKRSEKGDADFA